MEPPAPEEAYEPEAEGDPEWDSPEFAEPDPEPLEPLEPVVPQSSEVPTADVTLTHSLPGSMAPATSSSDTRNQLATQGVMNMLSMGSPSAASIDDDDGSDGGSLMFGADPSQPAPAPAPVQRDPEPAPAPAPAAVVSAPAPAPVASLSAPSPYDTFGGHLERQQAQMGGQFGQPPTQQQQPQQQQQYGQGYGQMNTQMMGQYGQMNSDQQKPFAQQDPTVFGGGGMGFGGPMGGGSWDMPVGGANGWGNGDGNSNGLQQSFSGGAKPTASDASRPSAGTNVQSVGQQSQPPPQGQQQPQQGYGQQAGQQPLWNMPSAAQPFASPQQYWMQGGGMPMMDPQYQQQQQQSQQPSQQQLQQQSDSRAQPSTGQSPPRLSGPGAGGFGGLKSTDKTSDAGDWSQSGGPPPARPPMPSAGQQMYNAQQPMGGYGGFAPQGGYGFQAGGQPGAYYPGAFSSTGGAHAGAPGGAQGNGWNGGGMPQQSWEQQQMGGQPQQRFGNGGGVGAGGSGGSSGSEPYRPPARRQGGVTAGPRGGGY